ncbi:hypothetical protein RhiJN_20665 [Ceratobasidium sp. AG-Ba]|nr:hypothetical protein RhiJN_20665 [Ceratobasidium sp. AG-Ba]
MPTSHFEPCILDQQNIVVSLASSNDDLLNACFLRYGNPLPQEALTQRCWVLAKLEERFSVHVGYDSVNPPYPNFGSLNITVYFDDIRVSDAFITAESIAARAEVKKAKRAEALKKQRFKRSLTEAELDALEGEWKEGDPIHGATEICGSPGDGGYMSPFHFALRLVTDENYTWGDVQQIGQIRVEVRWVKLQTGLPGSMRSLYREAVHLLDPIGRAHVGDKHRLVAAIDHLHEEIDPDVKAEREAEGGFRFSYEPLDATVYRFVFHYAEERVVKTEGFIPS